MSNTNKCDAVLIYSGGMDSTVLLYDLLKEELSVHALGFNYNQRHKRELAHAEIICEDLQVPFKVVHLQADLFGGSSQTSAWIDVPEGHYAEESMKRTVVPNRNMVMLSLAGSYAQSLDAKTIAYAAHSGDHAIYPDCRPEFVEAMDRAFFNSGWHPPRLVAPFLHMSKADIVSRGYQLSVPFEKTWSCYKGNSVHCGKCGTCTERKEAFELAGIPDPTQYERTVYE